MTPILVSAACLLASAAPGPAPAGDGWLVLRVGGDPQAQTELKVSRYQSGASAVESPLPVGYPAPTPPGAIELKRYPSVRRAEVSGDGDPDDGRNGAFWSLFQHIKTRDIAMTSPVEMDYRPSSDPDAWTMSFLYRTRELGPVGADGRVSVVDTEPLTVVSIGLRGPYGRHAVDRGLDELAEWLDSQQEWARSGEPRALYYNGPYVPDDRKWAEIQVPVRRVSAATSVSAPVSNEPAAMSPAELIELAIRRGAPLFNDHQPEACRAVYEVTIQWLLATPSFDDETRSTLRDALNEMRGQSDPREQAWTLRHALDATYRRLSEMTSAAS